MVESQILPIFALPKLINESMINRVLIRLKVVQIIYAYYQNGGKKSGHC